MDSFYEQPRSAPVPIHIEKTVSSPHVPDVSLILQSRAQSKPAQFNDGCLSYNVWKARKEQGRCGGGYEYNKENSGGVDMQSPSRKQVRFTGPVLQQNSPSPSVKQSSFEQIYIANIPNRRLDLSLVEPPRSKQKNPMKTEGPRVQSEFCVQQRSEANESNARQKFERNSNDMSVVRNKTNESNTHRKFERNDIDMSVVKQMNSRPPSVVANSNQEISGGYDGSKRHSNFFPSTKSHESFGVPLSEPRPEKQPVADNGEPTVKDLLKIIQQQNEQMILLQKQVASLLENKNCQKQIEDVPAASPPQFEPGTVFGKKLAIDVMTSFEVSIRQNFPHRGMFLKDFNCEPKIQEITESENVLDGIRSETKQSTTIDDTLVLGESLKIQEESPSPEHSIHVDMQDYSSDSDSESPDIGWTIYNNVMGQVNNILKKTNSQPNELNSTGKTKDKTTQRVKQATLQHLKSLGVSLPTDLENDSPSQSSASSSSEYTPSEISFAVKQLLMKYLPDDQLAKIMQQPNNNQANNCDEAIKFAKRRPEFSFATLQYMRKYNLLNVNADAPENHPPLAKAGGHQDRDKPKMLLDVTALKQQPKLL